MTFLLLVVIVGFAVFAVKTYNRLRVDSENVKRARADVVATMKKRMDTAQRLTDIASRYGEHEKLAHFTIGEMQADPSSVRAAETSIGQVVNDIRTMASHYPDLKANQAYQLLMKQLDDLEDRVLEARTGYNKAVAEYNAARSEFPAVLIAQHIGFPEADYFNVDGDGIESLAEFKTDDGTMLKAHMTRAAGRVAAVGRNKPPTPSGEQANLPRPAERR